MGDAAVFGFRETAQGSKCWRLYKPETGAMARVWPLCGSAHALHMHIPVPYHAETLIWRGNSGDCGDHQVGPPHLHEHTGWQMRLKPSNEGPCFNYYHSITLSSMHVLPCMLFGSPFLNVRGQYYALYGYLVKYLLFLLFYRTKTCWKRRDNYLHKAQRV